MELAPFIQNLFFGLFVGALYGLSAVGLSLVFGVMKVLNVAHGELIMLGGYGSFWLSALLGLDPYLSLLPIFLMLFLAGGLLHLLLFRPVRLLHEEARIKTSLLLGFGLALVLHTMAIQLWTADERGVVVSYSGLVFKVAGFTFPAVRLGNLCIAFLITFLLHRFLQRTYVGRSIRATAEDGQAAALMGIPVHRVYLLALALGSALAGVAGTLVLVGYSVSPAMGLGWTLKALVVVVLAGLGSMPGTFVAGLLLGAAESASVFFMGSAYREVVGLVIFLMVLVLRPQGLFGRA